MVPVVDKAFVYLTRRQGSELLVLAHPDHPDAGLQVPAGTVHDDEEPRAAARRELREETGLVAFEILAEHGETTFDMQPFGKPEWHRRHFYHAALTGPAPER